MEAYAVIATGGKQYRVNSGNVLQIEKIEAEPGAKLDLPSVLAVSDGKTLRVGTPTVTGAKVSASVMDHVRGPKLVSFKKNRRKGYARKIGHRQDLTVIKIESIA